VFRVFCVALGVQFSSSFTSGTGCLNPGGDLTKFASGDSPWKPYTGNQVQVHLTGNELGSFVVGAGLTADTQDGTTTLSIDPAYALPQGCLNKQVAQWNGSGWFCSSSAPTPLPTGP